MFKVYRVNTKTGSVSCESLKEDYRYFGNRGLIAKVMTDEVNPKCDPLGPENKLILSTGLLAGTPVTTAHRLSVGGKSPLTGGIKEANVGGNVAYLLAQHGIKMIIFEDMPAGDEWRILKISANGSADLVDASGYVGLNNYALVEKLYENYGKDIAVLSIGTAGERGSKIASLQATDATTKHPSRAAARGGLGAVAGSKKIKAVVVEKAAKRFEFPYADKQAFDEANKKLVEFCTTPGSPIAGMSMGGTISLLDITAATAVLPVNNFSADFFPAEKLEKINAKAWVERANKYGGKQGIPCQPGCIVKCSNVYNNSRGEYVTSGLEYETYALCGPNWDISDIDFIAEVDRICDDFGIDTMDLGNVVAVLMDVGKIPWGDANAVRDALAQMVEGKTELGKLMAQGTDAVGKAFGAKRIPTVKGQGLPAYDPRNAKGMGVTYATTPMGADHTAGYAMDFMGDNTKKEGKIELSKNMQTVYTACDNIACAFCFPFAAENPDLFPALLKGAYGGEWDIGRIMGIGAQTIKMEKDFNTAAGLTAADDRIAEFMYEEASPATGAKFDFTEEELQEIFK
ncbi:MAG: aldehyde ferredoxin oxidoreductase C-terminal domain-containing protein [Clostridiales bacterium]|nr:aldehyde ferredoxin oxidoreductase [Eubacteriales bacterium]MDH7566466.1 aldehyde ferredoxin oxidoreductase C-terminal domain-containing protein [Clostridiales bacterium]